MHRKNQQRILILGGSSFVGRHLNERLGLNACMATFNTSPFEGGQLFDSLTMRLNEIIDSPLNFSHAVILLGDTQPDSCVANPRLSQALNVDSIGSIFIQLKEMGIKPIFTSSEFVFDGEKGGYEETDQALPILLYGKQKLEAERQLFELGVPHTILRLGKVFGIAPNDGTLFTSWFKDLQRGSIIKCASDQAFSPIFVGDVVEAILRAIKIDLEGTFHVSGNTRFRRIELLEILLSEIKAQGHNFNARIEPCSIHDFDLMEKRPLDVSMSAEKIIAKADMKFKNIRTVCREIVSYGLDDAVG